MSWKGCEFTEDAVGPGYARPREPWFSAGAAIGWGLFIFGLLVGIVCGALAFAH